MGPDRGSVRDKPAHAAAPDYLRMVDTPMLRDRFQALVDLLLSPRAGGGYPPQPRQSFFGYGPKNSEDPYALDRTFDMMHRFEDLYTEKDKYTGKELDFFVPKFQLFCDRCRIYSVPEDALRRLFPTMLTGHAEEYYVHYLSMTSMGFDEIVLAIHAHFETSCDHDMILEDLTLQKIMAENRGKTQLECFELLIYQLEEMHYAFYDYSTDDTPLFPKLRRAVRGVPNIETALYAKTYMELVEGIRRCLYMHQSKRRLGR